MVSAGPVHQIARIHDQGARPVSLLTSVYWRSVVDLDEQAKAGWRREAWP
jgi:hypothetical protein